MTAPALYWLPEHPDWRGDLNTAQATLSREDRWSAYVALARQRIDFLQTRALDRALVHDFGAGPPADLATRPIRLAVLGSATIDHLLPAIRTGGLRRGVWVETVTTPYGQYQQELLDAQSHLSRSRPDAVLFALDARHVSNLASDSAGIVAVLEGMWKRAADLGATLIIQQTLAPVFPALLGEQEYRYRASPAAIARAVNELLRERADAAGVNLLSVDAWISRDGMSAWHDPSLWHHSKQEIHPAAAPVYGDMVARVLAAAQGLSAKALVLDLDNTLWAGVIGDDGIEGIRIGQGDALGEAHLDFQSYAKALSSRGILLAVCSKNDEANALAPFAQHPDMALRREDIIVFIANWDDKAANLRRIARALGIGLDALVFADDNPFERNLVRRELPMVATPELPEDPSLFAACISDAGYFEALQLTPEDRARSAQYLANAQRDSLLHKASDLDAYLRSLASTLHWRHFDQVGVARVTQLINKTNQFNLTTRRRTETEVAALIQDPKALTLQLRLTDRVGDNGTIAAIIALEDPADPSTLTIDTWLMSCRVLGRQVEKATLNLLARLASERGAKQLVGIYRPTAKNRMVQDHFPRLGFEEAGGLGEASLWTLDLSVFEPVAVHIDIRENTGEQG
jgi:FkbH-like protein